MQAYNRGNMIIQAWQESLSLFVPANAKLFMLVVLNRAVYVVRKLSLFILGFTYVLSFTSFLVSGWLQTACGIAGAQYLFRIIGDSLVFTLCALTARASLESKDRSYYVSFMKKYYVWAICIACVINIDYYIVNYYWQNQDILTAYFVSTYYLYRYLPLICVPLKIVAFFLFLFVVDGVSIRRACRNTGLLCVRDLPMLICVMGLFYVFICVIGLLYMTLQFLMSFIPFDFFTVFLDFFDRVWPWRLVRGTTAVAYSLFDLPRLIFLFIFYEVPYYTVLTQLYTKRVYGQPDLYV